MTASPLNPSHTPDGGEVQFYETNTQGTQFALGTKPLTGGGTATLSTTALAAGFDVLTATYTGTSAYAGSTTTTLSQWNIAVQKAVLTVTAIPESKPYAPVPALTYQITGFVNGDTAASLSASRASLPQRLPPARPAIPNHRRRRQCGQLHRH